MGLLISGGMLIPGNIPNIVAAARLKISMKEWAVIGVPVGLVIMIAYFLILLPSFLNTSG
jgi:predicted cation transporter